MSIQNDGIKEGNLVLRKAVIPVAGLGTRGLPFTKEVPKELLPLIDTPAIQLIVEEVINSGIEQVVFITSKGKSILEDYLDPSPALIQFLHKRGKEELAHLVEKVGRLCEVISIRQKEPLGLGHAIQCAEPVVGKDWFSVCLGDEIFPLWPDLKNRPAIQQVVEAAKSTECSVVGVIEVPRSEVSAYGIVDLEGKSPEDRACVVKNTIEKPPVSRAPSSYAIIGRYVFSSEIFDCLKQIKAGSGGEIQLTDAMSLLCASHKLQAIRVQGPRYDIGNHFSYVRAQIDFALRRPELASPLREYLKSVLSQ